MGETVHVMPTWEKHIEETIDLNDGKVLSLCHCSPRIEYKSGSLPLIIHHQKTRRDNAEE